MLESLNIKNLSTTIILDGTKPGGILGKSNKIIHLSKITDLLNKLKKIYNFELDICIPHKQVVKKKCKKFFGSHFPETHCFRGYPIYGSFKQFIDTETKYILHLDCDMIFYEEPTFSWIKEGVRLMEENEDILCVLPKGGPPTKDGFLHQGTTPYQVDEKRELYLFKNFTSRHYLIHRERFLSLLPLKPLWLSWREPIKSRLFGNGKMLCWETMVEHALDKSDMWRADLMTDQAWSLHPGDRCDLFYNLLPKIIEKVNFGQFPQEQAGHFDLKLKYWELF